VGFATSLASARREGRGASSGTEWVERDTGGVGFDEFSRGRTTAVVAEAVFRRGCFARIANMRKQMLVAGYAGRA
jgi:hypothetical protein